MNLLLEGDHPILAKSRQQYITAAIADRELTGIGFFTYFDIHESAPQVEPADFAAGGVEIQLEGLPGGAGCVLFIRDGKLSALECYTYSEPWPDRVLIKSLRKINSAVPGPSASTR